MVGFSDLKESVKKIKIGTDDWKEGFMMGLTVFSIMILIVSNGQVTIENSFTKKTQLARGYGFEIGFPSWENYDIKLTTKGISGSCFEALIEKNTGQKYTGKYCEGEKIKLNNAIIEVSKIQTDPDLDNPILFTYYTSFNLNKILWILSVGLPIYIVYRKASIISEKKEKSERTEKIKSLEKKLGKKTVKDLIDLIKEENEFN